MISAIIVAAGQGVRMGADRRKQYLDLGGQAILSHTIKAFDNCAAIEQILLVVPEKERDYCRQTVLAEANPNTRVIMVDGGARRQDSVCNGLNSLDDDAGTVLIHDGVRPFVSCELIDACILGAQRWGACIPALEVKDTLKKITGDGVIARTIDRRSLHQAQTPQAFRVSLIKKAHALSAERNWKVTDDASLVEQMGQDVHVIPGNPLNIKITTPEDLLLARSIMHLNENA